MPCADPSAVRFFPSPASSVRPEVYTHSITSYPVSLHRIRCHYIVSGVITSYPVSLHRIRCHYIVSGVLERGERRFLAEVVWVTHRGALIEKRPGPNGH
jgi:hypothetical protein